MKGYFFDKFIAPAKGGQSWSSYWTKQNEVLFFAETKNIADGKLYNQVQGATDYLTVSGSPATFQCPNNLTYMDADTDELWRTGMYVLRTATTAELIGFDYSRTVIKYDDASPYAIRAIMILKKDSVLTVDQVNKLHKDFHLPLYWSGSPNVNGYIKGNRGLAKSIFTPDTFLLRTDTFTKGWYDPLSLNGRLHSNGVESIYWDKMYPTPTLGAEENSGATVAYGVYLITATQANFFFTGCQVGDLYFGATSKGLSALNKVKRYAGNPLGQFIEANRPVNQVFNGVAHFMKAAAFTFAQPCFLYLVLKQISWTNADYVCDGHTQNACMVQQTATTPGVKAYAGSASNQNNGLTLGDKCILRVYFNGASSKIQVNEAAAITGNFGATAMAGFTLGSSGMGTGNSNIQFYEGILRTSDADEAAILAYLKVKHGL